MKIVDFTQGSGSNEWLAWRKNGVGASEISILMDSNPYKTPMQLWEVKCGFREEDLINKAMAHGIKNEPKAREWINANFQLDLKPICVEDNEIPYIRASLDGYDEEKQTLCEIKCPVSESVLEEARLTQKIPDHWFHQMQWQIMLTNPKRAIFALWDYRYKICITVEMFGEPKMHHVMKEKAKEFWHRVQIGKPPELQINDRIVLDDPLLHVKLKEYNDLVKREKTISTARKEKKKEIEDFGDDGNFEAFGYKVTRVYPRKTYDIEQMRLDGIDVDLYLKKNDSIGHYRINCPK